MRGATRHIILLTVALLAATIGFTAPGWSSVGALTRSIWDRVHPANQRVMGVSLSADGSTGFLASTHDDGVSTTARIWRSTDGGSTWAVSGDVPAGSWQTVATDSTGMKVVALGLMPSATDQSIHVSADGGTTWVDRTPSTPPTLNGGTPSAVDISPDGTTIAVATTAGVLISTDGGANWQTTGITASVNGVALSRDGSGLLINAFDGGGLRQVRISGSEVVNSHQPGGINNFAVSDNGQVILLVAGGTPVTTHLSLDGGATWTTNSTHGIGDNSLAPVAVSPDGIRRAVASYGGGIAESTGASATWVPLVPTGFTTLSWSSLAYSADGSTLLGGPDSGARLALRRDTPAPAVEQGIEYLLDPTGGEITVLGSYFYDVTSVTVRGVTATFTVVDPGEMTIVVPPGAAGTADLVITSAHGSVTVAGAIVYRPTPPPSIDGWYVDDEQTPGWSGLDVGLDGGVELYLFGEHFVDVTSITVGGRPVTEYEVDTDSTIVLILPAGEPGVAELVLTTAHGSTTLSDVIEYHGGSAPTIDSLGPTSGTHRGEIAVLVRGAGLNDTTEVLFGAEPAEFEVISPRFLVAYTPSNRIGLMDISITNPSGTTVLTDAWTSVWEPYSPEWSQIGPDEDDVDDPMTPSSVTPMSVAPVADPPADVTTVLPDGSGGFYLLGDFEDAGDLDEADLIVRWTGTAWATVGGDGSGDGRLRSSGETGVFYGSGVRTAAFDADGRLWVGGAFELDGREVNIARFDPGSGTWWAPTVVPDDIVETIEFDGATVIVGGDFGPLSGVPASSRIARLDPATDSWSAIGSDGSGGPAINGDGAIYDFGDQRTVHVVERDSDGSLLVGGSFRLSTTRRSYDMLARFDGTTWRTLLSSGESEMVTSVVRGTVDGVDSIVAGVCTLYDQTESWAGRVIAIPPTGPAITLGHFDDCVRDVEIVGDAVIAAGWFGNLELYDVDESDVDMRSVARYRNGTWAALSDTSDIDDVTVLDGHRLAAATTRDVALELSSISHLVGRADALSVTDHTVVESGSTTTVTLTGTGFNDRTDATIAGRPVANLEILSSTDLRFTTSTSNAPRTVVVYGDTATVSLTVSPPTPPPPLPSVDTIGSFPTRTLVPTGTVFTPGAQVTVTADGFTIGEEVWIIIASEPRLLGTATVGTDGLVTATVELPRDLLGEHTLVVWSPTTGRGVRQPITISSALLPATGGEGTLAATVALAVALGGAWLVLASRRRSA
jgi:hypothetical protein